MKKKIMRYVGFYNLHSNNCENRVYTTSAVNKMDYILNAINSNGYNVEVISPSWTNDKKFYSGKVVSLGSNNQLKLFPTLKWSGLWKIFSVLFSFILLFLYLLFKLEKNEQIIIYHAKWMTIPVILLKFFRRDIIIILEVEEIYSDVSPSKIWGCLERITFKLADKFIFPTDELNNKINNKSKPYEIVLGNYNVEPHEFTKDNEIIHIVYAGTFEDVKGGVYLAIEAAVYLPSKYHIHILGFGTNKQIEKVNELINKVQNVSLGSVSYEGLKIGNDYTNFLKSCHIGLSTQNSIGEYNNSSFPSKILSYMGNGLRVVSSDVKVVRNSSIGDYMYFYNENTPKAIADKILSIDLKDNYNSIKVLQELDIEFTEKLKVMLEK